MFETHACMNITEIYAVWFGNEHVVMYTHWTMSDWFEFEIPMADIVWPHCICAWTHTILIGDDGWLSHHISISIPLYSVRITLKDGRWIALMAVGYHLHSTRFCHMYNLEDSMVELKNKAQTSKHKHFFFVLESSVSELPKCFSTWFVFYFMPYNAPFHES